MITIDTEFAIMRSRIEDVGVWTPQIVLETERGHYVVALDWTRETVAPMLMAAAVKAIEVKATKTRLSTDSWIKRISEDGVEALEALVVIDTWADGRHGWSQTYRRTKHGIEWGEITEDPIGDGGILNLLDMTWIIDGLTEIDFAEATELLGVKVVEL